MSDYTKRRASEYTLSSPLRFASSEHFARKLEHERDLAALEKMKALEKKKCRKMKTIRVDSRTIVSATTSGRLDEIVESVNKYKILK